MAFNNLLHLSDMPFEFAVFDFHLKALALIDERKNLCYRCYGKKPQKVCSHTKVLAGIFSYMRRKPEGGELRQRNDPI